MRCTIREQNSFLRPNNLGPKGVIVKEGREEGRMDPKSCFKIAQNRICIS